MSNNIQSLEVSPPKKPASEPANGSIDAIMKAMNKVMLQETSLMLSFAKMMKTFNQNLLQYTKWSAEASNEEATSGKTTFTLKGYVIKKWKGKDLTINWDKKVNRFLAFTGTMAALSLFVYENPEDAGKIRTLVEGSAKMFAGYPIQILIGSQIFAELFKMNFAINKGRLSSDVLKIQAGTEKCKFIINFLRGSFDNTSNTLGAMSSAIKDALENDYNSKSKGLYFNKK